MIREPRTRDDGLLLIALTIPRQHTEDVAYVGPLPFTALDRGPSSHAGHPLTYLAIRFYLAKHDRASLRGPGIAKARPAARG